MIDPYWLESKSFVHQIIASPLTLPKVGAICVLMTPPPKLLILTMVTARSVKMLENLQHSTLPSPESRCHTTLIFLAQTLEMKLVVA